MKAFKTLILSFVVSLNLNAQSNADSQSLIKEIKVSTNSGHYSRAQRYVGHLRWALKVKILADAESYKLAYKFYDSVRVYKQNVISLDDSRAAITSSDEKVDALIEKLSKVVDASYYEQADAILGELKLRLAIKKAKENMQEETAITKKAVLKVYQEETVSKYKSTRTSSSKNEARIKELNEALLKPENAADDSVFSILQQELDFRNKLKVYVDDDQYLSASMEYRSLKDFLANPKPKSNKPAPKFVPETENQKRIVWLQEKMMSDKQAGKYINLWPMTQELNFRNAIETELKKGNMTEVENLKSQIKEIQFR